MPGPAQCQQHHQLAQVFGPAAEQHRLALETLQSLNLSLGTSPRTQQGGDRQRQDHPQPPLPSSQPGRPWSDAAGTGGCMSLLWATEGCGSSVGNECCSLCWVGKLMLSQKRVHFSTGVRSSLPQPAPQMLPLAFCQLCEMEAPVEASWEPPGPLQQMGLMMVTPHHESPAPA